MLVLCLCRHVPFFSFAHKPSEPFFLYPRKEKNKKKKKTTAPLLDPLCSKTEQRGFDLVCRKRTKQKKCPKKSK